LAKKRRKELLKEILRGRQRLKDQRRAASHREHLSAFQGVLLLLCVAVVFPENSFEPQYALDD